MKKFLKSLLIVLAVAVMAVMFAGCGDKSGAIKRAFEKAEYEVTVINGADSETLKEWLSEEKVDEIGKYEVITCTKSDSILSALDTAVIFKCPSKDEIVENLGQEAYDKAVESGYVNGNCFLFSLSNKSLEIFKNA